MKKIILLFIITTTITFNTNLFAKTKVIKTDLVLTKILRSPKVPADKDLKVGFKNYEDNIIKIKWIPTATAFKFVLFNKLEEDFKIIWEECAYIDVKNVSHRVIHTGKKLIKKEQKQQPTLVPLLASISDLLIPEENIYFGYSYNYTILGVKTKWELSKEKGWNYIPIFFNQIKQKHIKKMQKKNPDFSIEEYVKNRKYRVVLTIKKGDQIYRYNFFFKNIIKR